MDIGLHHLHTKLAVPLWVLLQLILIGLLLAGQYRLLATARGRIKWLRMGVEVLLLGSGLYLLIKAPEGLALYNLLKYLLLVATILLTVIAFRRQNRLLGALALLLIGYTYVLSLTRDPLLTPEQGRVAAGLAALSGTTATAPERGAVIYQQACNRCHGPAGESGWMKSKSLAASRLVSSDVAKIVKLGSKGVGRESALMPAYPYLTDAQLEDLTVYVESLRKPVANP